MSHISPVGPRATKEEFLRALHIDPGHPNAEGVYKAMREQAIIVFEKINNSRSNLVDGKRTDPEVKSPFFWHHVRPEIREQAVRAVWQQAEAGTSVRKLFDLGATDGDLSPNWVTLWLLYSVFRARDDRNNRSKRTPPSRYAVEGKGIGVGRVMLSLRPHSLYMLT